MYMENIIKKAIEGGWRQPPPCEVEGIPMHHKSVGFMESEFWQALQKSCIGENDWRDITEEHFFFGSYSQTEIKGWYQQAMKFHEINLDHGFDSAVKWLEEQIQNK